MTTKKQFQHYFFPVELVERIDAAANAAGLSRTAWLAAALEGCEHMLDDLPGPTIQKDVAVRLPEALSKKMRAVAKRHDISLAKLARIAAERTLHAAEVRNRTDAALAELQARGIKPDMGSDEFIDLMRG